MLDQTLIGNPMMSANAIEWCTLFDLRWVRILPSVTGTVAMCDKRTDSVTSRLRQRMPIGTDGLISVNTSITTVRAIK